jgi:hypothetical protein
LERLPESLRKIAPTPIPHPVRISELLQADLDELRREFETKRRRK